MAAAVAVPYQSVVIEEVLGQQVCRRKTGRLLGALVEVELGRS